MPIFSVVAVSLNKKPVTPVSAPQTSPSRTSTRGPTGEYTRADALIGTAPPAIFVPHLVSSRDGAGGDLPRAGDGLEEGDRLRGALLRRRRGPPRHRRPARRDSRRTGSDQRRPPAAPGEGAGAGASRAAADPAADVGRQVRA